VANYDGLDDGFVEGVGPGSNVAGVALVLLRELLVEDDWVYVHLNYRIRSHPKLGGPYKKY